MYDECRREVREAWEGGSGPSSARAGSNTWVRSCAAVSAQTAGEGLSPGLSVMGSCSVIVLIEYCCTVLF